MSVESGSKGGAIREHLSQEERAFNSRSYKLLRLHKYLPKNGLGTLKLKGPLLAARRGRLCGPGPCRRPPRPGGRGAARAGAPGAPDVRLSCPQPGVKAPPVTSPLAAFLAPPFAATARAAEEGPRGPSPGARGHAAGEATSATSATPSVPSPRARSGASSVPGSLSAAEFGPQSTPASSDVRQLTLRALRARTAGSGPRRRGSLRAGLHGNTRRRPERLLSPFRHTELPKQWGQVSGKGQLTKLQKAPAAPSTRQGRAPAGPRPLGHRLVPRAGRRRLGPTLRAGTA